MQYISMLFFAYVLAVHGCQFKRNIEVEYYQKLIEKGIDDAVRYRYPEDASEYRPISDFVKDFGNFDFIIVGAGTTGAVMANRLSRVKSWNILLIEAGKFGNNFTDIPNMVTPVRHSEYNWGFKSTPQTTACLDMVNRRCIYPRGKGVGGSSLINGLIYARGTREDFDKWSQMGNPGWSFNEVLPYFKISENFRRNDRKSVVDYEYHGTGGELNVVYSLPRQHKTDIFLQANKELGYHQVDYNGRKPVGVSAVQANIDHGLRDHSGNAFIKPIRNRPNLKIVTEAYVTKLILGQNKNVEGVEFTYNGLTYRAQADFEVILSAGTFGSAQILMLSGIGPQKHLEEVGVPLVEDLPVGSSLIDHPMFFGLTFNSNYTEPQKSLREHIEDYLKGRGSLTNADNNQAVGFYRTKWASMRDSPDLEIVMGSNYGYLEEINAKFQNAAEKTWQHYRRGNSFAFNIISLHARSLGSVRLKSSSPFDYPLIDSNFLTDKEGLDIGTLLEGVKLGLKLIQTAPYREINATLFRQNIPDCADKKFLSDDYWRCILRHLTSNEYHPVGSCPMGPDPKKGAVVNPSAEVYGIGKLRVADASIIPINLSGHPNAACFMIGEKVSDLIKAKYL